MVKVGDIFVSTWGWEQTNASFFQVVGITKSSVKVRPIKAKKTEHDMVGTAVPIRHAFDGETMTRRLKKSFKGEVFIDPDETIRYATLWDGKPIGITSYG